MSGESTLFLTEAHFQQPPFFCRANMSNTKLLLFCLVLARNELGQSLWMLFLQDVFPAFPVICCIYLKCSPPHDVVFPGIFHKILLHLWFKCEQRSTACCIFIHFFSIAGFLVPRPQPPHTGQLIHVLHGHSSAVYGVALSAAQALLLVGPNLFVHPVLHACFGVRKFIPSPFLCCIFGCTAQWIHARPSSFADICWAIICEKILTNAGWCQFLRLSDLGSTGWMGVLLFGVWVLLLVKLLLHFSCILPFSGGCWASVGLAPGDMIFHPGV